MRVVKTLSSKGQVQLPKAWRDQVGIGPGTKLALQVRRGLLVITSLRGPITEETAGSLRRYVPPAQLRVSRAEPARARKGGPHNTSMQPRKKRASSVRPICMKKDKGSQFCGVYFSTVTGKFQITIPMAIARKLDLKKGDKIIVEESDKRILLTLVRHET